MSVKKLNNKTNNKTNSKSTNDIKNILLFLCFVACGVCMIYILFNNSWLEHLEFIYINNLPQKIILTENVTNNPTIFIGNITIVPEQQIINQIENIRLNLYLNSVMLVLFSIVTGIFISYFINKI